MVKTRCNQHFTLNAYSLFTISPVVLQVLQPKPPRIIMSSSPSTTTAAWSHLSWLKRKIFVLNFTRSSWKHYFPMYLYWKGIWFYFKVWKSSQLSCPFFHDMHEVGVSDPPHATRVSLITERECRRLPITKITVRWGAGWELTWFGEWWDRAGCICGEDFNVCVSSRASRYYQACAVTTLTVRL